jgi:hypothetical protein
LALARAGRLRGYEAPSLRLLGEIAARRDLAGPADGHYADALALAEKLGFRPLIAHCHLGLARLSRRAGKCEQVQQHVAKATAMYREMGMTYWLEQMPADAYEPPAGRHAHEL